MAFSNKQRQRITSAFYLERFIPSLSLLRSCRNDDGGDPRGGIAPGGIRLLSLRTRSFKVMGDRASSRCNLSIDLQPSNSPIKGFCSALAASRRQAESFVPSPLPGRGSALRQKESLANEAAVSFGG